MRKRNFPGALVAVAGLMIAAPQPALAYLDPGTGSLILQGLLAAVAGIMVGARFYWHKVKAFANSLLSRGGTGTADHLPESADSADPEHRQRKDSSSSAHHGSSDRN